jgi:anthranilate synthase component 1
LSTLERKKGSGPGALDAMPPFADFKKRYAVGTPQVVWMRLVADLERPVSAYLKLAAGRPMSFLLESVEGGAARGRYSVIGLEPDVIWRAEGDTAFINRNAIAKPKAFKEDAQPTLASLRALLDESRLTLPPQLPPMSAGIFGYMGYDTVRLIERLPDTPPDALGVPDSILMRPTVMVIFDVVKDEITIVTPVRAQKDVAPEKAYKAAAKRLKSAVAALDEPVPHTPQVAARKLPLPKPDSNTKPAEYMAMGERAREYIVAGDIFQAVLAQRFSAPFTLPSFALYRALRRTNPSPYLFHLDFGGFALVGSSPEILVRVRDG